jgi:uncharacterized protein
MQLFSVQKRPHALVIRILGSLSHLAVRHPKHVLVIAGLVVLAAAPGVLELKLRTDGRSLVSKDAPEVIYDQTIRDQFGIKDQLIVLIRSSHADGIFNPDTLQLIRDLSAEFQKLPGVAPRDIMSVATEPGFRFRPGTWIRATLLEPPLKTEAELAQLREDLRKIELYSGTLVSSDGKSTVVLVGVPGGADRAQFYGKVLQIIATQRTARNEVAVTGAPVAESLLGVQVLEDLGVPRALLGAGAPGGPDRAEWKLPTSLHELRLFAARRIGLVPVAALVMMFIFLLCFRNFLAAVLPLPGVAATMVFVFGLMGWLQVPIYLTTAVMPVLLTVISVTNDIYLFSRYFTLLREKPGVNQFELLGETIDKLVRPVAATSLTAAIGFLSFGFSPLVPVRAFGIFTGVGALFGLLFSLTVVPALLALTKPARLLSGPRGEAKAAVASLGAGLARAGQAVVRRRRWVAGLAIIVAALTALGLRRLAVQDSWTSGFDPESDFRRVTRLVNENFFGMHLLFVSVEAPMTLAGQLPASAVTRRTITFPGELARDPALILGSPITVSIADDSETGASTNDGSGCVWRSHIEMAARRGDNLLVRPARDEPGTNFWPALAKARRVRFEIAARSHYRPELIRTIGSLGSFIRERRQYAVGGVLGPMDYLMTTRFMVHPGDPNARVMPDDAGEVKVLWDYYGAALGPQRLRQIVDTNYLRSLTTVFLKDANFVDTAKLMKDIRDYERERLAPKGIKVAFAGDVAVSQSLVRGIVTTQMQSLIWSLAGIFAVTALFGGSLRWGFYCLLPSLLAVVIKFAVMGWAGIPLGVATSMFAAMTLGLGVNCAVHLLESCGQARADGASPTEALNRSLRLTGPPALINTLAVSLGFGVLMLSPVPANARLGILVVLGLVNCFVLSLLALPLLLHWWPLKGRRSPGH